MIKKITSIILVSIMLLAIFAGCKKDDSSGNPESTENKESANPDLSNDISEKVKVVMWMSGANVPRDFDKVVKELSDKLETDLNCTLDFNLFNDSNTQQKMMMLLSSGEPIDLMYSANYLSYTLNANKSAYMELDDLIKEVSPNLHNYVSEEFWDGVKVDGKIYMVPSMWEEWVPYGFLWREDLRKKHNLPKPVDIETVEAYMAGIKENEPDIQVTGELPTTYGVIGTHFSTWEFLDMKYRWADFRVPYGLYIDYQDPTKVIDWWESDEFREDMKMFKRWADAGYWSKSALATTEQKQDAFKAGKIACDLAFNSPSGYSNLVNQLKQTNPDWEVDWLPMYRVKQLATKNHPTQNGFSIPITSENPERALMVLEKLTLDKEYFQLSQYGIEGEHYTVNEDGFYEYIGSPDASGFPRESSNLWATRNEEFMLYPETTGRILKELNNEFREYTYPNIWTGFTEDSTEYQAERAAFMNVQTQYLPAIQAGLVDDVDKAIDIFIAKAKEAGLDKIREEYTKQWLEYVKEHNIQPITLPDN